MWCVGSDGGRRDGFPSCYDLNAHPLVCHSNVGVCTLITSQDVELLHGTEGEAQSLAVSNAEVYSPASQLDLQKKIISRSP